MSEVIGAGTTWTGHLQWHGEMHRKLGGRSLHFWFMRLSGLYEKEKTFTEILKCMEIVDAVAYAGYELSGEFDVMLRLWLPPSAVGKFADLLKEKLRPTTSRYYSVVAPRRHWVWEEHVNGDKPGLIPCEIEALDPTTIIEDISTLNRLSDESHRLGKVEARTAKEAMAFDRFYDSKAIKPVDAETGIRLVLRLRPGQDVADEDLERIISGITDQLDGLRETAEERLSAERSSELRIREFSLYTCADSTIIVLCRIDYRAWHLIRQQLLTPLGKIPGLAQTTTFPVLSAKLEISREALMLDGEVRDLFKGDLSERIVRRLPTLLQPERYKAKDEPMDESDLPKPPPGPLAVREFLDRDEGEMFEAKGSAFAPLEDWLNREIDAPPNASLEEDKGFFRSTIAKSIVAMLNTNGGVILIGVLETDRYEDDSRERLRLRLKEVFPREGRFRLLGLQDPIYQRKRWDGFDRKFHELLIPMIDGEVGRRIQLLPGWHNGREFAIVRVHGPGPRRPRRAYYLKDGRFRFLIRRGARSEELHGNAILDYMKDDLGPDSTEG